MHDAPSGVTRGGSRSIGPGRKLKNSKNPIQKGTKKFFLKGHLFYGGAKILIWPRATNTLVTPLDAPYSWKTLKFPSKYNAR